MKRKRGDRGPGRVPQCPTCLAAGCKPVKKQGWVWPDGRVKQLRVKRKGRMVTLPAAWVVCQRRSGHFGDQGPVCGWGWWCTIRQVVALAQSAPIQLLRQRRAAQAASGRPGGGVRMNDGY